MRTLLPPGSRRGSALPLLILVVFLGSCAEPERYTELVEIAPIVQAELVGREGEPDYDAMLASYQDHGPIQMMTIYGDFDEQVAIHHRQIWQYMSTQDLKQKRRTGCSMFQLRGDHPLVGRNYDNVQSDLFIGMYYPVDGYASIALTPLREFGFGESQPFDPENLLYRRMLLKGATITIEGMNARGLTVTLASLGQQYVEQQSERPSRFLLHLVREMLDHAADVEEAVEIAKRYNVFDNGCEVISHHIFVADPNCSVVLEWNEGRMEVVEDAGRLQVITNSKMLNVSEADRRSSCRRYQTLARRLGDAPVAFDWSAGMDALAAVAQNGGIYTIGNRRFKIYTVWSAIFDQVSGEVLLCMNRDYTRVYRIRFPENTYRSAM